MLLYCNICCFYVCLIYTMLPVMLKYAIYTYLEYMQNCKKKKLICNKITREEYFLFVFLMFRIFHEGLAKIGVLWCF